MKTKVRKRLQSLDVAFEIPFGRKVRATGPNWHQIVLDIKANLHEVKEFEKGHIEFRDRSVMVEKLYSFALKIDWGVILSKRS